MCLLVVSRKHLLQGEHNVLTKWEKVKLLRDICVCGWKTTDIWVLIYGVHTHTETRVCLCVCVCLLCVYVQADPDLTACVHTQTKHKWSVKDAVGNQRQAPDKYTHRGIASVIGLSITTAVFWEEGRKPTSLDMAYHFWGINKNGLLSSLWDPNVTLLTCKNTHTHTSPREKKPQGSGKYEYYLVKTRLGVLSGCDFFCCFAKCSFHMSSQLVLTQQTWLEANYTPKKYVACKSHWKCMWDTCLQMSNNQSRVRYI